MSTHFDYEASAIHSVYDEARRLPPETLQLWMNAVARFAPPTDVRVMLDIGCGTGRFLEPLARGLRAQALGLDGSLNMLGEARAKLSSGATGLTCALAEALPVRTGCVDLVFLSMVYHHLADRDAALRESRRVLRPAGHLLVRTATAERLDSHLWLRFFAAARPIEVARTPSTAELVTRAGNQGLALCHHVVIRQPFAPEPVV
ncbi:MAG: class I SAM-dependent methyltransferase, partial [Anaerolineae bacterium]|nr:class I SAM-dependent methyltransferase [Anaerolineae bacterium]